MKQGIPQVIRTIGRKVKKLLFYSTYDSTAYWKKRSNCENQAAVLWANEEYNNLYRAHQRVIITEYLNDGNSPQRILDIGCGIGVVAMMMAQVNLHARIDAVDFEEMVSIAKRKNSNQRIHYLASSAEEYCAGNEKYDLIVSSGCYSAIRDIKMLEVALANAATMVKQNGRIVMIDPFHRWNYLARAKYNSNDVMRFMNGKGLVLVKKSGVLFWPFREFLANSKLQGQKLKVRYEIGEKILGVLGKHFWADYKVLVFVKRKT